MRFKSLLLLLLPLSLQAMPGYELPWGRDAELAAPSPTTHEKKHSLPVKVAEHVIRFHQQVISPVDGPRSHFFPSSSQYMLLAMQKHGFIEGYLMGCDRLLRENDDAWVYRTILIGDKLYKYDPVN